MENNEQKTGPYLKCRFGEGLFPKEHIITFRQMPKLRKAYDWMFVDGSHVIPREKGNEGLAQIASIEDGGDCYRVVLYNMGDNFRRYVYKEDVVFLDSALTSSVH